MTLPFRQADPVILDIPTNTWGWHAGRTLAGPMPQSGALVIAMGLLAALSSVADAAPKPVAVFLERNGRVVDHEGEEVEIPRYGGGDAAWGKVVTCVKAQFAPFQLDVVDREPSGEHITAVVGGLASQLGLDDRSTNGVGPYMPGRIQRNATVHIFSKVGTGERDTQNLCAVTVHEVSHALGLDHVFKCGDVMSYYGDRCGARKFLDVTAPCGEFSARACGTGEKTQNSYRMLASLVGLKHAPQPEPEPEPTPDEQDPLADDEQGCDHPAEQDDDEETTDEEDVQSVQYVEDRRGNRYTMERVQGRDGRTYIVLRRVR